MAGAVHIPALGREPAQSLRVLGVLEDMGCRLEHRGAGSLSKVR